MMENFSFLMDWYKAGNKVDYEIKSIFLLKLIFPLKLLAEKLVQLVIKNQLNAEKLL